MRKPAIVKDSILYILSAGLSKGALLLLIPYLTLYLSVGEFGQYDFLLVFIGFLSILFSFGLPQALQIEFFDFESNRRSLNKIFSTHFFLSIGICIVLILVMSTVTFLPIKNHRVWIATIIVIQAMLYFYQTSFLNILKLKRQTLFYFKQSMLVTSIQVLFSFLVLLYLPNKLLFLLLVNLLSALLGICICYKRLNIEIKYSSIDVPLLVDRCKQGFILVLSYSAYWVINGADRWIVLKLLGSDLQGTYSIAARVSSVVEPLLITPLLAVLLPISFEKYKTGSTHEHLRLYSFFSIIFFLSASILSPFILPLLLSETTPVGVYKVVPYFILGYGFYFISQFAANLLVFKKKFTVLFVNILGVALFNVIINITFSYYFGIEGAGIAFLLTNIIWALLSIVRRQQQVKKLFNENSENLRRVR